MTGAVSFVVKIFTEVSASVASMVVTALVTFPTKKIRATRSQAGQKSSLTHT